MMVRMREHEGRCEDKTNEKDLFKRNDTYLEGYLLQFVTFIYLVKIYLIFRLVLS